MGERAPPTPSLIVPHPNLTILVRCTLCKGEDHIQLQDTDLATAQALVSLLDGSSTLYVSSPRHEHGSVVGRCVQCGGVIDAEVVEA